MSPQSPLSLSPCAGLRVEAVVVREALVAVDVDGVHVDVRARVPAARGVLCEKGPALTLKV